MIREMQVESGSQQSALQSNVSHDIGHIHLDAGWNRSLVGLAMKLYIDNFLAMCFNFLILNEVHAASCALRTTVVHQFH